LNPLEKHRYEVGLITIAKGAGIVFFGTIIGSGLRYVLQIVAARNLGAELFGLFSLGFAVYRVVGAAAELGLPNGLLRYVAIFRGRNDLARTKGVVALGIRVGIISGLVFGLTLFFSATPVAIHFFGKKDLIPVLRYFSIMVAFSTLTTIILFCSQGFKIMVHTILVREIIEPSMRFSLFLITAIFWGWRLCALEFAYVSASLLGLFTAIFFLEKFRLITIK
jgi:O-antigen/teichoic acid export membrane protein